MAVSAERAPIVNPPLPAPVKLNTPAWQQCQDGKGKPLVCLSMTEAKKTLRNKTAVGHWMTSMDGVVSYYRNLGDASAK